MFSFVLLLSFEFLFLPLVTSCGFLIFRWMSVFLQVSVAGSGFSRLDFLLVPFLATNFLCRCLLNFSVFVSFTSSRTRRQFP